MALGHSTRLGNNGSWSVSRSGSQQPFWRKSQIWVTTALLTQVSDLGHNSPFGASLRSGSQQPFWRKSQIWVTTALLTQVSDLGHSSPFDASLRSGSQQPFWRIENGQENIANGSVVLEGEVGAWGRERREQRRKGRPICWLPNVPATCT